MCCLARSQRKQRLLPRALMPRTGRCAAAAHRLATALFCPLQLAARIAVSNLHKNTLKSFSET